MIGVQEALLANCVLRGCPNLVDVEGDACRECLTVWGPHLLRRGERSAWEPTHVPECRHGLMWFRRGRCDRCGNTELRTVVE